MDEISPNYHDWQINVSQSKSEKVKRTNASGVLTVHEPVQTIKVRKEVAKTPISETMAEFKDLSNSKISNDYVKANAEIYRTIQKVIQLVQNRNNAVIARLPPPWRERFNSFAVDPNGLLHMDNRLVIPKDMRKHFTGNSFRPCGKGLC